MTVVRILAETRLLSEYLAARYPHCEVMLRRRVGQIPAEVDTETMDPAEIAMLGVWRRWVDAIVLDTGGVIIVESAVVPDVGKISQLELYLRLFPATPEFQHLKGRPLRGVLVYAIEDPTVSAMAAERGLTVHIFRPPWVDNYLLALQRRAGRAPVQALPGKTT